MKLFIVNWVFAATFATVFASSVSKSSNGCSEQGDCILETESCTNKCGCDWSEAFYYNATTDECSLNIRGLMLSLVEKYNVGEKLHVEAEQVFRGILISAVLIIACSCICVLSACIYCCRITYYDTKLNSDVKALNKKLGRDKMSKIKTKVNSDPKAESCNVVVEDAGLFVC